MPTNRTIPESALRFRGEKNQFSIEKISDGKYSIRLIAFSGKPFTHWWWGRCVFDRSGAVIPLEKIPIDYEHDSREGLGFLETFGGGPALECAGFLLPFTADDRANEIISKKERGMPYQCSVNIGEAGLIEEFVSEGTTAEVNGETVIGPITIFRQFEVLGVAICLYGSDPNTTVFNNQHRQGANPMPKETSAVPGTARDEAKLFAKKFGDTRGFKYFSDGLSLDEALSVFADDLSSDIDEKDVKIAELIAKIAELEAEIVARDARIVELEAQLNTANTADSETVPVSAEEFKRLQAENLKFKQAAGQSGGESQPLSGGNAERPRKQFSPLPPGMRAFADNAKHAVDARRKTG